jgi:hypothetical protein
VTPYPDDDPTPGPPGGPAQRELAIWHARGVNAAKVALLAGTAGALFLSLSGLKPAAVAIPLFLASVSLLLGAASAALFAWVAYLQLEGPDADADDGGGGSGGGPDDPPKPPDGGDLEFDWQRFEGDFDSYCERLVAALA